MKQGVLKLYLKEAIRIFVICGIIYGMPAGSKAQVHKEECLEGDCKNGYGLKKITTTYKDPRDYKAKPSKWGRTTYYYYLAGEFKSKKLNGNGYRFEFNYAGLDNLHKIKQLIKEKGKLAPVEKYYIWFEQGEFKDDLLNGKGFTIDYNTYNGSPLNIKEGEFKDGLLNGQGVKLIFNNWGNYKDSMTGKYILKQGRMFEGRFEQNLCMECTVTEKQGEREGHMTGKEVSEIFFSGWMMSDFFYESGKIKNMALHRVLYIGGEKIASLQPGGESTNIKKVELDNGRVYYGECDAAGQPFGFGKIETITGNIYEGQVDNGRPDGYGWYHSRDGFKYYAEQQAEGGLYKNRRFIYGAFFEPGTYKIIKGGIDDPTAQTELNSSMREVMIGPYTLKKYGFDAKSGELKLEREESGVKKDGSIVSSSVAVGMTKEERVKQRKVTNGRINISDLVIGDVVVINGIASPVIKEIGGLFYLKNEKYFSSVSMPAVQLSKYSLKDFDFKCQQCLGSGSESYTYQQPPEQIVESHYRKETIVGDYTVITRPVLEKVIVTKTFSPVKRIRNCSGCNGTGVLKNIAELKEN